MIPVRSESLKSNNWLAKLSRGDYGVGGTFLHLVAVLLLAVINFSLLREIENGSVWVGYLAIVCAIFYGIYITNTGMGFWRLARRVPGEVKVFLLRLLSFCCVLAGITAVFNGIGLIFTLFSIS
ncbi:hypothetical protein DFO54_11624 [Erwinia sp. AG740]|nr:hypothetical protein DFO54_11624 [Erwinia sp. AG740]